MFDYTKSITELVGKDFKKKLFVANFLRERFNIDAYPIAAEEYDADVVAFAPNGKRNFEVKAVLKPHNSPCRFSPEHNPQWDFNNVPSSAVSISEINDVKWTYSDFPKGGRYWMLNAQGKASKTPKNDKWNKMIEDNDSCLIYLFPDGIQIYSHKELMEAYAGYGWYDCSQRTAVNLPEDRFKSNNVGKELKVLINLDKGKFYPIEVPKEIFEQENLQKYKLNINN